MDVVYVLSIMLVFFGIGLGIGYVMGFRKGVQTERQRQAEKEETA